MDFDEIVVKGSPGLCRCCLSEGCYKDLSSEYAWMNDTEIYADMLLECFDISISQHVEGPNGSSRLICEVCITRLRDACNFKKQVLDSEKKFVDMVGRGEFRSKVVVFQAQMKTEPAAQEAAEESVAEVEYLEDIDYGDDDDTLKDEPTVSDIMVSQLPEVTVKRTRGKKTTIVKPKKAKEEKPKTSKAAVKELKNKEDNTEELTATKRNLAQLTAIRKNIQYLLHYGNVTPFVWSPKHCFLCFYCNLPMSDFDTLKKHTHLKHMYVDLETFISKRVVSRDLPVKFDIRDLHCKVCSVTASSVDELGDHIVKIHKEEYDAAVGVYMFPFVLSKQVMKCALCDTMYDNINRMLNHMYRSHMPQTLVCQVCGLTFGHDDQMTRHMRRHDGYKCMLCDKIFDNKQKMLRHKETIHERLKARECTLCSETFDSPYRLKVHMGLEHNVERYRYKCQYCDNVSRTKGSMDQHMRLHHSGVKFECYLCEYKHALKEKVELHMRTKHFGVKNHACSICERRFGRAGNLTAHMKIHTGKRGRVCRWCQRGFVDDEALIEHGKATHFC